MTLNAYLWVLYVEYILSDIIWAFNWVQITLVFLSQSTEMPSIVWALISNILRGFRSLWQILVIQFTDFLVISPYLKWCDVRVYVGFLSSGSLKTPMRIKTTNSILFYLPKKHDVLGIIHFFCFSKVSLWFSWEHVNAICNEWNCIVGWILLMPKNAKYVT